MATFMASAAGLAIEIVGGVLGAVLLIVTARWAARTRKRRTDQSVSTLRNANAALVVALVGLVLFIALPLSFSAGQPRLLATLFMLPLILLSAYGLADYLVTWFEIERTGFSFRTPFQRGRFEWSEIESVRWSGSMRWLVLETLDARRVRMTPMLDNQPAFAAELLAHVQRERFTDEAHEIALETAAGRPPAPWGP